MLHRGQHLQAWLGVDARRLFARAPSCAVSIINDADAAGYAEMHFGAGRGRAGVVLVVTLGTGIGTAIFVNGHLVPNTELGHSRSTEGSREVGSGQRARRKEPELEEVGEARRDVSRTSGALPLARPLHRRRRRQQEGRQVPSVAEPAHAGRRGQAD